MRDFHLTWYRCFQVKMPQHPIFFHCRAVDSGQKDTSLTEVLIYIMNNEIYEERIWPLDGVCPKHIIWYIFYCFINRKSKVSQQIAVPSHECRIHIATSHECRIHIAPVMQLFQLLFLFIIHYYYWVFVCWFFGVVVFGFLQVFWRGWVGVSRVHTETYTCRTEIIRIVTERTHGWHRSVSYAYLVVNADVTVLDSSIPVVNCPVLRNPM